jgi:hypothetical protein
VNPGAPFTITKYSHNPGNSIEPASGVFENSEKFDSDVTRRSFPVLQS